MHRFTEGVHHMAVSTNGKKPLTLADIQKRNDETYLYDVKNFGTIRMRGITHRDMREVRAKHENELGIITDIRLLAEDLAIRACVEPPLTIEVIDGMVDSESALLQIGRHAGYRCGYLSNPPPEDLPETPAEVPPTSDGSAPSNAS